MYNEEDGLHPAVGFFIILVLFLLSMSVEGQANHKSIYLNSVEALDTHGSITFTYKHNEVTVICKDEKDLYNCKLAVLDLYIKNRELLSVKSCVTQDCSEPFQVYLKEEHE